MTEPTQAPAQSRVHPMAMLEELAAENDYLRKRSMMLANELHALRTAVQQQAQAEAQAQEQAEPQTTAEGEG